MKRITMLILSSFFAASVFAQNVVDFAELDIADVKARVNANGSLFWDGVGNAKYEVPKGSGKHSMFATSLWLGGENSNGQLCTAFQAYNQGQENIFWGPIMASSAYSTWEDSLWNRVWKVNKSIVAAHIQNYATSGYVVPEEIATWPGNGNISKGQAAVLAPYQDVNENNTYDPQNGDYPLIKGDQCVFFINNDSRTVYPSALPLGAEIHGMLYAFTTNDITINRSTFLDYTVYNRSSSTWNNFYMGEFSDIDLGYYEDDLVGCDSVNNYYFAYNGDADDDLPNGYGTNPPAQAVVFMNRPMHTFGYFDNSISSPIGQPETDVEHYNSLKGLWKDGTHWVNNGQDGHSSTAMGSSTNYMYTGDACANTGWLQTALGDKRSIASTEAMTLFPGESTTLSLAFVYQRSTSSVCDLQNAVSSAILFAAAAAPVQSKQSPKQFSVYPNPVTNGAFTLKFQQQAKEDVSIELLNINGQIVKKYTLPASNIGLESEIRLPQNTIPGIYFLKVNGMYGTSTEKIIVQ